MKTKKDKNLNQKGTSTSVIRTGVYPHMLIAVHHETQTVYNTGCHRASGSLFLTPHMVRSCPASLSHDRPTYYHFFHFLA